MVTVSVILPSYNRADWLEIAIKSILEQTFSDFELIIIDDASTDHSADVIRSFSDSRIKPVFKTQNEGYPTALQEAIQLAQGEFIARMDSDDISRPTRLEKQVNFLRDHKNVMVVGAHAQKFNAHSQDLGLIAYPEDHDELMLQLLTRDTCMVHPVVMFRASVFEDFNYDLTKIPTEDYDLWARIGLKHKLANIQETLLDYRLHDGQESVTKIEQRNSVIKETKLMLLSSLSINATSAELALHSTLFLKEFEHAESYLIAAENWLTRLLRANDNATVFNQVLLSRLIGALFFELCTTLAPKIGKKAINHYSRSNLNTLYKPGFLTLMKFKFKALL